MDEKMEGYGMGNPYEAELIGLAAGKNRSCNDGFGGELGPFLMGALLGGRGLGFGGVGYDGVGRCCGHGHDWGFGGGIGVANILNDNWNSRFDQAAIQTSAGFNAIGDRMTGLELLEAIGGVKDEICDSKLAMATGFGTLGAAVVESRYQSALGNQALQAEIAEGKYAALLTAKDASAQLAECCCEIKEQGILNTQKILDSLAANKLDEKNDEIQQLRFKILKHDHEEDSRNSTQIIGSTITTVLTSLLSGNQA